MRPRGTPVETWGRERNVVRGRRIQGLQKGRGGGPDLLVPGKGEKEDPASERTPSGPTCSVEESWDDGYEKSAQREKCNGVRCISEKKKEYRLE